MNFAPSGILQILAKKGCDTLYHANTVQTSCTFLEHGALISRGVVSDRGWPQTDQYTDPKDRQFDIWYDIFIDVDDLHESLDRANLYGPVLFKIDPKAVALPGIQAVRVTRSNPSRWQLATSDAQRYLLNLTEVESALSSGRRWNHMLVLRQTDRNGMPLMLKDVLKEIVVDDPAVTLTCADGTHVSSPYTHATQLLANHAQTGGLAGIEIVPRGITQPLHAHCQCANNYATMNAFKLKKNFCL